MAVSLSVATPVAANSPPSCENPGGQQPGGQQPVCKGEGRTQNPARKAPSGQQPKISK